MSIAVVNASPAPAAAPGPVRVMVVDDSVVVRGLVSRWIEAESDLAIVASLRTGRDAVNQVERTDPDVVVLDVDMPDLDGISALPLLLEKKSDLVVIMASTLTRRNAEISLKALSLGAADYIPKPESSREVTTSQTFRRDLIEKIRQLGTRRRRRRAEQRTQTPVPERSGVVRLPLREPVQAEIRLRPFATTLPRVLLIGSSTGGPQAVTALVGSLGGMLAQAPVLITQHMPPTFTTIFAEHLARASGRPAREAEHGEPINAGRIYVAPGGRHLRVERRNGIAVVVLDEGPAINFCKPAVDPLFASAAEVWGKWNLAVVLTGMGQDGARGAADVIAAGGSLIAQDEATSVVWGMPGTVAQAGLCSAVLPLDQIAPKIVRLFAGDRR
jgi:two-component system, chemotaxis family, protein-glutamate methylesterase/glutaminase